MDGNFEYKYYLTDEGYTLLNGENDNDIIKDNVEDNVNKTYNTLHLKQNSKKIFENSLLFYRQEIDKINFEQASKQSKDNLEKDNLEEYKLEKKRKNTESARRSRGRKVKVINDLKDENKLLKLKVKELMKLLNKK